MTDDDARYQYLNEYERRYFEWAGIEVVSATDGHAEVRMPVQQHHRGGGGSDAVNGGIAAYLFDGLLGAAVRSTWDVDVSSQVTMTLNIEYLRPLLAQHVVTATGDVTHRGRSSAYVRGEIYDESGQVAMACTGIYRLFRAHGR